MSRNTDPDRATVIVVRDRDGGCVVCGTSWSPTTQHRKARAMGGTHSLAINRPSNLIVLCGSGTTGHHGWVEAHPTFSREAGWALRSTDDPLTVPVLYPDGWFLLDDLGNRIPDPLTSRPAPDPGGHRGCFPRGWRERVDDPHVGGSWPPAASGEEGSPDALRPWGSAHGG